MEETEKENTETTKEKVAGDVERLAAENEALRTEIRIREATYDIEARLKAAGARSPGLLVKEARDGFQFGDDGKLVNPEALVERLRRSYPEQFGLDVSAGSIDAAAGRNSAPPLTRDALARMSPAEIRQLDWDEVRAALSAR